MIRDSRPYRENEPNEPLLDLRNPGTSLDLDWLRTVRVSRSEVVRRARALTERNPPRREQQAALLLRAISCFDLTPVLREGPGRPIRSACASARQPVGTRTLELLGAQHIPLQVGAVCVPCDHVAEAARALRLSGIPVAGNTPVGGPLDSRLDDIASCAADGAEEIDIEVSAACVRAGAWQALHSEVAALRTACGPLLLKAALPATCDLPSGALRRTALVCAMAGADFIGIPGPAGPAAMAAAAALRDYHRRTGCRIGLKIAAGIDTAPQVLHALVLMKEELSAEWIRPALFRIATGTAMAGVERQLDHFAQNQCARPARRAA